MEDKKKSEEELDKEIEEALMCPCVADIREGPCGPMFINSFRCFLKSKETERGMDCLDAFQELQECMLKNPEHFSDFTKNNPFDTDTEKADENLVPNQEIAIASSNEQSAKRQIINSENNEVVAGMSKGESANSISEKMT